MSEIPGANEGAEEAPPTPGEVAAEAAELGVMLAEAWWRTMGRAAELGLVEPMRIVARLIGPATSRVGDLREVEETNRHGNGLSGSLKEQGAELLRRSADVNYEEGQHPAFLRILDQLAPDEARILRLLADEGAQPIVDVRNGALGLGQVVAGSLTMVAAVAGCRYPERFHSYLTNLSRLGLVVTSDEQVQERQLYQLLEAQPAVVEALAGAGRLGRTVRRSLILTPFGRDFCEQCLQPGSDSALA